jgi:hypothetical protein
LPPATSSQIFDGTAVAMMVAVTTVMVAAVMTTAMMTA